MSANGTKIQIELKGVSKAYGGVIANKDISLQVPEGKITGLIGPNGSGKTTLFNSIVGYHPIDEGSIAFEGREISTLRVPEIARLGMLRTFQQTRIYKKMPKVVVGNATSSGSMNPDMLPNTAPPMPMKKADATQVTTL